MIVRGTFPRGRILTVNLQPGMLTVAFDEQTVLAYDRAGRLWSAFVDGVMHRRGYHGRVLAKQTVRGQRVRRWLSEAEADTLVARASGLMRPLAEGACVWDTPTETLNRILARAAHFAQVAAQDAHRFLAIYKPIGILPPDQYMALVLQLTEGCSFNACTFCTFYHDRPFRIKSASELAAHTVAALEYMGEALPLRKGVFLADANALVAPQKRLMELLDAMHTAAGGRLSNSCLYAFLDGFSGAFKSPQDYAELAGRGLRRVYIGLESGHNPLLRFLNKPGSAADAVEAARAVKAGGVGVCVIILLGTGGAQFAEGHIYDTINVINALELGAGDMIYFSEFVAQPGQPYGIIAAREHIQPLVASQLAEQRCAIQASLRFPGPPPKISTYDIREFVY